MSDRFIIMITGAPGTGKSTLASSLVEQRPGLRTLSTDAIRRELSLQVGSWPATERAYRVLCDRLRASLAKGESAVLDATFFRHEFRRMVYEIVLEFAVPLILIQVSAPPALSRQRVADRAKQHESCGVNAVEAYDRVVAETEEIGAHELPHKASLVGIDCTDYGFSLRATSRDLPPSMLRLLQAAVGDSAQSDTG